ncbi:MAG: 4-hydroxy-3-methylbut-2-enyl diphosphate reductase [Kiritimatiellae bacterium]|nr:4-hydroxy-3-methylbut-2-enyl diphosphate reductase [Kiritimatiellia bacterium]
MKVDVAQSAGFCWGVRRAVEIAHKTAEKFGTEVFTDGPLIHNRAMMQKLEESGVKVCKDPATLPENSVLIIRAHGIPPERQRFLESLPIQLVDATCLDVRRIHNVISKYAEKGYFCIILGDKSHAEVIGLMGYAIAGGFVVSNVAEVADVDNQGKPVCLVAQSTQAQALFDEVAAAVKEKFGETAIVENTICRATQSRQGELKSLAESADAFVIVGSPESANTQRLALLAKALLPTYVVDSAEQLDLAELGQYKHIAISAGASSPDFAIKAVEEKIRTI